MRVGTLVRRLIETTGYTYTIEKKHQRAKNVYDEDGLRSIHNCEFTRDPGFCTAYQRGVAAAEDDYHWRWRVHVGLWAAYSASKLDGDFVECGVNRGFLSSAIMEYLHWDSLDRTFYLLDTFHGMDERYVSEQDANAGALERNIWRLESGFYVGTPQSVQANFSEWKNVKIIPGSVPETLDLVDTEKVAYLHLDMNCSPPEVAAFNFFWERLVPGAFVLLDDYAYKGHESQKAAMDTAVRARDLLVVSLPTGQGLLIKPTEI
jgi:hypothetical protein